MFKFLKDRKKKDNKGFTLVELVIVIAILAILVGLLAPQYTKYVEKSRKAADASNMDEMVKAIKIYAADPANELPAGGYKITISSKGTSVTVTSNSADNKKAAEGVLTNSVSADVLATKVKSSDWGTTDNAIDAVIEIGADYTTTVKYEPDKLSTFVGKDKVGVTPTP